MELNSYKMIDDARTRVQQELEIAENDARGCELKLVAAEARVDELLAQRDDFDRALDALESTSYVRLNA